MPSFPILLSVAILAAPAESTPAPTTVPSVQVGASGTPALSPAKSSADLTKAADTLAAAIQQFRSSTQPAPADATAPNPLAVAARSVIEQLGSDWHASKQLLAALDKPDTLAATVRAVEADLRFRPRVEAPVPPNWPPFTPPGELEIKRYPTYRAAFTNRTPILFKESRNFWTLFQHIQNRNIPMTAPVEMPMRVSTDGSLSEASMGFLYPDTTTGQVGPTDGNAVTVVDVPEATVVSIAIRGKQTDARLIAAHKRLIEWLAANNATWTPAGPPRVLGWNSPSMPDPQSYTELQVPITRR